MKKALITGIMGSGGSYLAERLLESRPGVEVHGLARWHSTASASNLDNIKDKVRVHDCDLGDLSSVCRALESSRPEVIFHLASHANVKLSFTNPISVMGNNIFGTLNLFEGIRILRLDPLLVLCSTSEVYGQVDPAHVPITEQCPLQPTSPYAVSKLTQDMLGLTYFRSYGMRIIRTRMFAYFNARRADLFATAFARQVARIERGEQTELVHGNLDSVRTLIDVRDAMEAYCLAAEHCTPGEVYNIGGSGSCSVREILDELKSLARVPIPTRQDPDLIRPADVTLQIPEVSKFKRATGWKPTIPRSESLAALLEHFRRAPE